MSRMVLHPSRSFLSLLRSSYARGDLPATFEIRDIFN